VQHRGPPLKAPHVYRGCWVACSNWGKKTEAGAAPGSAQGHQGHPGAGSSRAGNSCSCSRGRRGQRYTGSRAFHPRASKRAGAGRAPRHKSAPPPSFQKRAQQLRRSGPAANTEHGGLPQGPWGQRRVHRWRTRRWGGPSRGRPRQRGGRSGGSSGACGGEALAAALFNGEGGSVTDLLCFRRQLPSGQWARQPAPLTPSSLTTYARLPHEDSLPTSDLPLSSRTCLILAAQKSALRGLVGRSRAVLTSAAPAIYLTLPFLRAGSSGLSGLGPAGMSGSFWRT